VGTHRHDGWFSLFAYRSSDSVSRILGKRTAAARSIPPTHKLMVKIHKSDATNYSREQLNRMRSFPGVELVAPSADREIVAYTDLFSALSGILEARETRSIVAVS
jgi:hypothetical protein